MKPRRGTLVPDEVVARKLVRRVHLAYERNQHVSLLSSVTAEGRCAASEAAETRSEGSEGALPPVTRPECPTLPPMTFAYGHVQGASTTPGPLGHEPFVTEVRELAGAPGIAIDDDRTDFFDVNGDALPDLVSTDPTRFRGGHGLFLHGKGGLAGAFGAPEIMGVAGLANVDALTLSLTNANVAPMDLDADGTPDLVHSPSPRTMNVFAPRYDEAMRRWVWFGKSVPVFGTSALAVDFGRDAEDLRALDVNGDGLADVVKTGGQTTNVYFALGRFPGGHGRWGTGKWQGPSTASLSSEPVRTCVPMAGFPMRFGDEEVKVGDMNGDGLPDLVRLQFGMFRYWPGHGDGTFGTKRDCAAGTFPSMTFVELRREFAPIVPAQLSVADVNGDGLDDVVQVRSGNVDVWVNEGGERLLPRITLPGLPWAQGVGQRFRLHDVNGNGTPDLFWGDPNHYRYVDMLGGRRPWLLERVENGLGKTTELAYAPSTELMLAAERAGTPWATKMPTVQWVITKKTERDNLGRVGREDGVYTTEYAYRDPVYEGRSREFRGFSWASSTELGAGRAKVTESAFELGACVDDARTFGVDACTLEGRWKDQPREALKGRPLYTLTRDHAGTVLEVSAAESDVRLLATGLDGREVRAVVPRRSHVWKFDTSAYAGGGAPVTLNVHRMLDGAGNLLANVPVQVPVPGSRYAHLVSEEDVDLEGHVIAKRAFGCTEGALCNGVDDRFTTTTEWTRVGPEALLWAQTRSYVTLDWAPNFRLRDSLVEVDALGRPAATRAVLVNTVELDRRHEVSGRAVAPSPANRSQDRTVTTGEIAYDAVGHVVVKKAPAGACVATSYEAVCGDAVVLEQVASGDPAQSGVGVTGAAGQPCGPVTLARAASHDRGLGQPVRTVNEAGEPTQVAYDGLGRLAAVTVASATAPGQLAGEPQLQVEWSLPNAGEVLTRVRTRTRVAAGVYREGYSATDGLGRALGAVAEANDGDPGAWVVSGTVTFDDFGRPWRSHVPFFTSASPSLVGQAALGRGASFAQTDQDVFGRVVAEYHQNGTGNSPGSVKARVAHRPLATDTWDAEDLQPNGPHAGTYATSEVDGHGRARAIVERVRVGATLEERATEKAYLPTGEVGAIVRRVRNNASAPVVRRWVRYDTLGRMTANGDANTSAGFVETQPWFLPPGGTLRVWRYAYDDAGQLVGTSDARGCGVNFQYDAAGRVRTEDHSPCTAEHPAYTPPTPGTCAGYEVCTRYDSADAEASTVRDSLGRGLRPVGSYAGRVASVTDKAQKTVLAYDGRGRVTGRLKRVALVDTANPSQPKQLAPRAYLQEIAYDEANRVVSETTGVTSTGLQGAGGTSTVTSVWDKRGAVAAVTSSYGDLVSKVTRDAQGRVTEIVYADAAKTTTQMVYDGRGRLVNTQTFRTKPSWWTSGGSTSTGAPASYKAPGTSELVSQAILESRSVTYDEADNPVLIADGRTASEWPAGAKPVTKRITYDSAYRVTRVEYLNPSGATVTGGTATTDTWVDPFDAEDRATPLVTSASIATANPKPAPHAKLPTRVKREDYVYDSLGNILTSSDDANAFYDRSLGAQSHGTPTVGPYQLRSATNRTTASASLYKGALEAQYDAAGNLTAMVVQRDTAGANCLPSGASCWQRYAYAWDEVGRLIRASRWDLKPNTTATANEQANSGTLAKAAPTRTPDARMAYLYDGADERVVKTTIDSAGVQRHTVDVFGNYKLRLTKPNGTGALADYTLDQTTEQVELQSHGVTVGRVEVIPSTASTSTAAGQRTLLVLHDALGSAGIVLDRTTGQLAEAITYTAYGQTESDYRPPRFSSNREDERFTGKEEDVEIGLVYFGKRYLVPAMARWASADPLAVHAPGEADLNLYAYVHGRVYVAVDPDGLEDGAPSDIKSKEELRSTIGAQVKSGVLVDKSGQLAEWSKFGEITIGEERFDVDLGVMQLIANAGAISSRKAPTEILSLASPGRGPHGRRPRDDSGVGHVEAVDISRVAGYRFDLSWRRMSGKSDAEWAKAVAEVIHAEALILGCLPSGQWSHGVTRPGRARANKEPRDSTGAADANPDHRAFMQEGPDFVTESNRPNGPHSLAEHLPWMTSHAKSVLSAVVDKMRGNVSSLYLDGVDHAHFGRGARK